MANGNRSMNMGAAAAGIGAALAAAAGAYWLYGAKDAAKHRRLARSWMLKARADVMDAVEKVQNIDRKQYMAIVDKVVAAAAGAAAATRPEIARVTRDLRAAWSQMQKEMKQGAKQTTRAARSTAKKVSRTATKTAKRTAKKISK